MPMAGPVLESFRVRQMQSPSAGGELDQFIACMQPMTTDHPIVMAGIGHPAYLALTLLIPASGRRLVQFHWMKRM